MRTDILCLSARNQSEILPTLQQYCSISNSLYVARHPNSDLLSGRIYDRVKIITEEYSVFNRLYSMIENSSSDSVFIAADDDYIVESTLNQLSDAFYSSTAFSCARICTFHCSNDKTNISITPYLNSPSVASSLRKKFRGGKTLLSDLHEYFMPLSIDFYSIYNREKLLFIFKSLKIRLTPTSLSNITNSYKVFMHILAFAQLISGQILDFPLPVYIRGNRKPLRFSNNYKESHVVDNSQLLSFDQELKILLDCNNTWFQVVDALVDIYSKYGHHSDFIGSPVAQVLRQEISDSLRQCLFASSSYIRLNLLNLFRPPYKVLLKENHGSVPTLQATGNKFQFIIDPGFEYDKKLLSVLTRAWPEFLPANITANDLASLYKFACLIP